VIYLDTSVALAQLLSEDRTPPARIWNEELVSSRLLEFELWTRLNARRLAESHGDGARALVACVGLLEMVGPVLARALEPFPVPVRTFDALHLASMVFIRERLPHLQLATYDTRLMTAARKLGIPAYRL
jgi:predicted nucleic acid-binding protein